MTSTTYYNLNIVEGTDIVNPLIVDNPNYEKIDEAMHNNAVAGVTLATEIANATVHAITRENSDCAVIRFIATSQWKAGDTATVDGVPVTALLPSGETLPDGAYVINANVLCILTGTNLTIYAERNKVENANEIPFNNTTVGAELVRLDGEVVKLDGKIVRLNEENLRQDNEINTVNSKLTRTKNTSINNLTLSKENGRVFAEGKMFVDVKATIPVGFRPASQIQIPCIYTNTSYVSSSSFADINTDGSIIVKNNNGQQMNDGWFCLNVSWLSEQ